MNRSKYIYLFLLLIFGLIQKAVAQDTTAVSSKIYEFKMKDGNIYLGPIKEEGEEQLIVEAFEVGRVTLKREDIESMEKVSEDRIVKGKIRINQFLSASYFLTSNALPLKKGEVYYQNILLVYNQVTVGIHQNFSLGVGIAPDIFDENNTPIWLAPKLSFPLKNTKISFGVNGFVAGALGGRNSLVGLAFGSVTFGGERANLSFGVGPAFEYGDRLDKPVYSISGMIKGKERTYLISENFIIYDFDRYRPISLFGGRTHLRRSIIDYGMLILYDYDYLGVPVLPWLGVIVPF